MGSAILLSTSAINGRLDRVRLPGKKVLEAKLTKVPNTKMGTYPNYIFMSILVGGYGSHSISQSLANHVETNESLICIN